MIVLIGFGIWRKLTKKESVKIARYEIPVPYKIFFYFNSSFRTVFLRIRIFADRIRIFGPSGSGLRKKIWSGSGKKKTRIRNTVFFTERYPPVIITAVTVGYYGTFISAQKNCNEQLVNNPTKITCITTSLWNVTNLMGVNHIQGGKMGTFMNRGGGGGQGPPGPPGGAQQFDIGNKLTNLNLDHNMKMMNRQSGPGTV